VSVGSNPTGSEYFWLQVGEQQTRNKDHYFSRSLVRNPISGRDMHGVGVEDGAQYSIHDSCRIVQRGCTVEVEVG
jgi:hypothetical protein